MASKGRSAGAAHAARLWEARLALGACLSNAKKADFARFQGYENVS